VGAPETALPGPPLPTPDEGAVLAPDVPRPALPPVFPPRAGGRVPAAQGPDERGDEAWRGLPDHGGVSAVSSAPEHPAEHGPEHSGPRHRTVARGWRPATIALGLVAALLVAGTTYLWRTSDAWQQRAADYEDASRDLGALLADERARLTATNADLESVRDQLATAQTRIIELANEKAQLGDDREAQRMLADYQERISDAAGRVAKALDQCVQGQNRLIGYLRDAALYDPKDLDAYSTSVQQLCQQATDANTGLQGELSR
jgi:hypothetical protein